MSVLLECEPGDEFFCIREFYGSPDGETVSAENNRKFTIGERLKYVGSRRNQNLKNHPSGWHVVFQASDRKTYSATQVFFVTKDTWQALKRFFVQRLMQDPIPKQAKKKAPATMNKLRGRKS